jgi:hypothetical protein
MKYLITLFKIWSGERRAARLANNEVKFLERVKGTQELMKMQNAQLIRLKETIET